MHLELTKRYRQAAVMEKTQIRLKNPSQTYHRAVLRLYTPYSTHLMHKHAHDTKTISNIYINFFFSKKHSEMLGSHNGTSSYFLWPFFCMVTFCLEVKGNEMKWQVHISNREWLIFVHNEMYSHLTRKDIFKKNSHYRACFSRDICNNARLWNI